MTQDTGFSVEEVTAEAVAGGTGDDANCEPLQQASEELGPADDDSSSDSGEEAEDKAKGETKQPDVVGHESDGEQPDAGHDSDGEQPGDDDGEQSSASEEEAAGKDKPKDEAKGQPDAVGHDSDGEQPDAVGHDSDGEQPDDDGEQGSQSDPEEAAEKGGAAKETAEGDAVDVDESLDMMEEMRGMLANLEALTRDEGSSSQPAGGESGEAPGIPVPRPQAAAGSLVSRYHIKGFANNALNTIYSISHTMVGGKQTYWSPHQDYFMYFQADIQKWQISPRSGPSEVPGSPDMDLLMDAMKGGQRGLAMQVEETAWRQFCDGVWQLVDLQIGFDMGDGHFTYLGTGVPVYQQGGGGGGDAAVAPGTPAHQWNGPTTTQQGAPFARIPQTPKEWLQAPGGMGGPQRIPATPRERLLKKAGLDMSAFAPTGMLPAPGTPSSRGGGGGSAAPGTPRVQLALSVASGQSSMGMAAPGTPRVQLAQSVAMGQSSMGMAAPGTPSMQGGFRPMGMYPPQEEPVIDQLPSSLQAKIMALPTHLMPRDFREALAVPPPEKRRKVNEEPTLFKFNSELQKFPVWVGFFPDVVPQDEIRKVFAKCGPVVELKRGKCQALVYFETMEDRNAALQLHEKIMFVEQVCDVHDHDGFVDVPEGLDMEVDWEPAEKKSWKNGKRDWKSQDWSSGGGWGGGWGGGGWSSGGWGKSWDAGGWSARGWGEKTPAAPGPVAPNPPPPAAPAPGADPVTQLEIPKGMMGVIIGKGGEVIKRLQEQSGAKMKLDKVGGALSISGPAASVAEGTRLVQEILQKGPMAPKGWAPAPNLQEASGSESMEIPRHKAKEVIGKGGETIRKLEAASGAGLKVDGRESSGPCVVRITGPPNCIAAARKLLAEIVGDTGTAANGAANKGNMSGVMAAAIAGGAPFVPGFQPGAFQPQAFQQAFQPQAFQQAGAAPVPLAFRQHLADCGKGGKGRGTGGKGKALPSEYMDVPLQFAQGLTAVLRMMQQQTGARISVEELPEVCRIRFAGSTENIVRAKAVIRNFTGVKEAEEVKEKNGQLPVTMHGVEASAIAAAALGSTPQDPMTAAAPDEEFERLCQEAAKQVAQAQSGALLAAQAAHKEAEASAAQKVSDRELEAFINAAAQVVDREVTKASSLEQEDEFERLCRDAAAAEAAAEPVAAAVPVAAAAPA